MDNRDFSDTDPVTGTTGVGPDPPVVSGSTWSRHASPTSI